MLHSLHLSDRLYMATECMFNVNPVVVVALHLRRPHTQSLCAPNYPKMLPGMMDHVNDVVVVTVVVAVVVFAVSRSRRIKQAVQ